MVRNSSLTKKKYLDLIAKVKTALPTKKGTRKLMERYGVLSERGTDKLVVPASIGTQKVKYYVHDDEMFDVLQQIHLSSDHGGRRIMTKLCKQLYANILGFDISLYIKLCSRCQSEKQPPKPTVFRDSLNTLGQLHLIDYRPQTDGRFNFIFVYVDNATKFVILRPLETVTPVEIAAHLLDIFLLFGPPAALMSYGSDELCNNIHTQLIGTYPELIMMNNERNQRETRKIQDIQSMLRVWLSTSETNKWCSGLTFVQFAVNTTFDPDIKTTPFEAMFGCKPNMEFGKETSGNAKRVKRVKTNEKTETVTQSTDGEDKTDHCDDVEIQVIQTPRLPVAKENTYGVASAEQKLCPMQLVEIVYTPPKTKSPVRTSPSSEAFCKSVHRAVLDENDNIVDQRVLCDKKNQTNISNNNDYKSLQHRVAPEVLILVTEN